ncbi:MAG: cyanoexosortase A [Leptolyngbyaceae cyanobacterium CSU_1_3]|nr:cyanoexosortase A [Leptolyngbyaceae cyanobacterium CSU_1_3]
MKTSNHLRFSLLGLLSGSIALHLSLVAHSENSDLLGSSVLFWLAIVALLWKKRFHFDFSSDVFSSSLGAFLVALVLIKSTFLVGNDIFLRVFPFLCILGIGLIASGVNKIDQYWRELGLLAFFIVPSGLVSIFVDISIWTAKFAALVLWCLGFEVSRQALLIHLPKGSIEVYAGCSGMAMILQLLGLALIYLCLCQTKPHQKLLLPAIAIGIAFVMNGVRVALMAVLVALSNQSAFEYWHVGNGSLIFSTIAVVCFGMLCNFLIPQPDKLHG